MAEEAHRRLEADASGWAHRALAERDRLVGLAFRVVRHRSDAEDVVDDVLARFAGTPKQDLEDPMAFLGRMVLHRAIDRARSWVRRHEVGWTERESSAPDPHEVLEATERRERLWREILRLAKRQREVLILHQLEGMPYAEVATVLEIAPSTARALCFQARDTLRQRMKRFAE